MTGAIFDTILFRWYCVFMSRSNEWNESLEETIERSHRQNGLLVYSMVCGEEIEVGISGHIADGVEVGESRIIRARSLGLPTGALDVLEDTSEDPNWKNRVICLGSFAYNVANIEFARAGLLRGFIGFNQGVVVDLTAQHFVGQTKPEYLLAQYKTLDLEGQKIF